MNLNKLINQWVYYASGMIVFIYSNVSFYWCLRGEIHDAKIFQNARYCIRIEAAVDVQDTDFASRAVQCTLVSCWNVVVCSRTT